jgi:hypothetical protein
LASAYVCVCACVCAHWHVFVCVCLTCEPCVRMSVHEQLCLYVFVACVRVLVAMWPSRLCACGCSECTQLMCVVSASVCAGTLPGVCVLCVVCACVHRLALCMDECACMFTRLWVCASECRCACGEACACACMEGRVCA